MKKITILLTLCSLFLVPQLFSNPSLSLTEESALQSKFSKMAQEPGAVTFRPPEGWLLTDPKALPANVKVMVVGKGTSDYPPSLNLTTERFAGTLKQYVKIIKAINDNRGDEWKDLGTFRTEAGDASLSQVDSKTKWGTERLMHVVYLKNGNVYILTAAALKEDFSKYYKEFFDSFRSLNINKDVYEMVPDASRKTALADAIAQLKNNWSAYLRTIKSPPDESRESVLLNAFQGPHFQEKEWVPFKTMLGRDFQNMGADWQGNVLKRVQNELLEQ